MVEKKLSVTTANDNNSLSVTGLDGEKQLTITTNELDDDLPDYSHLFKKYYTRNYRLAESINYKEGDKYLNEFIHFMTVVAYMIGQTSGEENLELVYEKNLFKITCPEFTGEEEFYLESLDFYLLFFGFYTTLNITSLLEKSVLELTSSNFYNKDYLHLYCFYNEEFTDFTFTRTEKFTKNTQLIAAMSPLLWDNVYYKLRRDVLEVGGTPFLVNGEPLELDIVVDIDTPSNFNLINMTATISNKAAIQIFRKFL